MKTITQDELMKSMYWSILISHYEPLTVLFYEASEVLVVKMPKHEYTSDEIARSYVTAFLKNQKKEMRLDQLIKVAQAIVERLTWLTPAQQEACQPEMITQACQLLVKWHKIEEVAKDTYCLPAFMPKYRSLDATWLS